MEDAVNGVMNYFSTLEICLLVIAVASVVSVIILATIWIRLGDILKQNEEYDKK